MNQQKSYFGKDLEAMSFANNYHRWILDEFRPYLGREIAEVGAGVGNFSDFLLHTDIAHLTAFEPSDNMYPLLEQKFADVTRVDTLNAFFEDVSSGFKDHFDSVLYVNVLEHIEHDATALQHAYQTLKGGGHLLVFVPALSFLYSDLDKQVGHFRRYSRDQLAAVAAGAGFTVRSVKYFDIVGIIPWYLAFVLMRRTATGTNVSLYDRLVVPVMRRIEGLVRPPIGKNLILVARKD